MLRHMLCEVDGIVSYETGKYEVHFRLCVETFIAEGLLKEIIRGENPALEKSKISFWYKHGLEPILK